MKYLKTNFKEFIREQLIEQTNKPAPIANTAITQIGNRQEQWLEAMAKFNEILNDYDDLQK